MGAPIRIKQSHNSLHNARDGAGEEVLQLLQQLLQQWKWIALRCSRGHRESFSAPGRWSMWPSSATEHVATSQLLPATSQGIAIAIVVFFLVLLLGFFARRRRQRTLDSIRPAFQTNQAYQHQPYQPGAYLPQTGYGYPNGQQQYVNSVVSPQGGQLGSGSMSYPPPAGPTPTDQPERVDGRPYAPPSQPPPSYQK